MLLLLLLLLLMMMMWFKLIITQVKGKAAIDVLGARLGKSGGALGQQALVMAFGGIMKGKKRRAKKRDTRTYSSFTILLPIL